MLRFSRQGGLVLTVFLFSGASHAVTTTYTDRAAFMAALPGAANTLDFDSGTAPFTINSGDTLGGITFSYSFATPSVTMQVSSSADTGYATTSGTNFLAPS